MIETESAGGIVVSQYGNVALVSQRGEVWSFPKGHIEAGETPIMAAKREITEETGLTEMTFIKPLGQYTRPKIGKTGDDDMTEIKTIHLFLFSSKEIPLNPLDSDNPSAKWVSPNDVEALLTHSKDRSFFVSICLSEIMTYDNSSHSNSNNS